MLELFMSGTTDTNSIAVAMNLTPNTVRAYFCRTMKKYNVNNRAELMAKLLKTDEVTTISVKPDVFKWLQSRQESQKAIAEPAPGPRGTAARQTKAKKAHSSRILAERWIKACEEKNNCDLCREGKACRALYDTLI
jgi:hypothetical protein